MESVGSLQDDINVYLQRNRTDLAVAMIVRVCMHTKDRQTVLQNISTETISKVYLNCLNWLDCLSFANLFLGTKIYPSHMIAGEMLLYMRMKYEMISHFQNISLFECQLMQRFLVEWGEHSDLESLTGLRAVFNVKANEQTSVIWAAPLENKEVNLANVIRMHKKKAG